MPQFVKTGKRIYSVELLRWGWTLVPHSYPKVTQGNYKNGTFFSLAKIQDVLLKVGKKHQDILFSVQFVLIITCMAQ